MFFSKKLLTICILISFLFISNARAQISLIRDTQIERFIRNISTPIFNEANLDPAAIKIYIINDDSINAFVSSGQKLFINSGLLSASDNILGIIGVIAHETGHISGGHIARISSEGDDIRKRYALGFILGVGAALSGNAEAAQAIILGNMQIAQRNMLSYTRAHEEAADEAAIKYLTNLGVSTSGLVEFFKLIKEKERINVSQSNEYTRSHPLTENRINRMEVSAANQNPELINNNYITEEIISEFFFVKGKLEAFLTETPEILLKEIKSKEELSFVEKYQKAVLLHRVGKTDLGVEVIDELIREEPEDYYLLESKGQFLFENGQVDQAIVIFEKILDKIDSVLVKIQYASAINSTNEKVFYNLAITQLNHALIEESESVMAWDLLAELYGKNGYLALSDYAQGESFYLQGKYDLALIKARQALAAFEDDLTFNLSKKQQIQKANDLIFFAQQALEEG